MNTTDTKTVNDIEDSSAFCRQVESYLCRKNDGHLIRIVGPAFEQVCAWAEKGIPLRVAYSGIDRTFERYYAKGPRRRPVRVEFCEADILDVFDEWRRALGVPLHDGNANGSAAADANAGGDADHAASRHHSSLPEHVDRVVARLTSLRAGGECKIDDEIAAGVRELDGVRGAVKGLRGAAREALLDRLRALDASLLAAARAQCDPPTLEELAAEASSELASFRGRMPADGYAQAHVACVDRLIRERFKLPAVAYER